MGVSIPMKATFFITYIMVDGWAGIAAEVLRLVPLVMFHLKNTFLVKTERDRDQAMDPGSLDFSISEPRIQLYFLLGLVYSSITPILLPFIVIFFAFAYMVFRHQVSHIYFSYMLNPNSFINQSYTLHKLMNTFTSLFKKDTSPSYWALSRCVLASLLGCSR